MTERSIAVIGAGITGVTTAYALAEQGYEVTVYDRQRYPGMETSFANGGQLSASNAEVWNNVGTVAKGLKWMFRKDAPLLLDPSPGWHKYSWIAEFIASIPNYRQNTVATVKLAIAARSEMRRIAEKEGIAYDREERGILHFYATKSEFEQAQLVSRLLAQGGLERRPVTPSEMRTIEPRLVGDFYGGCFTPSDATGDIHKFTSGLAVACANRGVTFHQDTTVDRLTATDSEIAITIRHETAGRTELLRHDGVVICAGSYSRDLARQVGDRVNVYPVKGYSITVNLNDEASVNGAPWVSLLDDAAKIVTSRLGEARFRVAGTAEFAGYNRDIRQDRIEPLVQWVNRHFPDVSTRQSVPWAGLRPMLPSMLPRVGPGRCPRVFYNTGHGHLGWTLSAATAALVSAHVAKELPN